MGEPAKKAWNWGKTALLVSLALNLLVAGALVGASLGAGNETHERNFFKAGPPGLRAYIRALPSDQRQEYFQETRKLQKRLRKLMRNSAANKQKIAATLKEEPFSKEAFHTALDQQSQDFVDVLESYHTRLIAVIDGMTPDERAAYAQRAIDFKVRKRKRRQKN